MIPLFTHPKTLNPIVPAPRSFGDLCAFAVQIKNEIEEACATIVTHPLLWRKRKGGFRRLNCEILT